MFQCVEPIYLLTLMWTGSAHDLASARSSFCVATPKDATGRPRFIHTLGSQRIDFTGLNTAHDVGMWFGFNNQAPDHSFQVAEFGHYEDRYVKTGGRWYFQERRIYNERLANKALFYPELGEADPREK